MFQNIWRKYKTIISFLMYNVLKKLRCTTCGYVKSVSTYGLRMLSNFAAPLWNHIADIVEYNPEVLNSPEFLASLAMEQGDDPSTYDWETPIKRNNIPIQAKEVPEYLAQAQF